MAARPMPSGRRSRTSAPRALMRKSVMASIARSRSLRPGGCCEGGRAGGAMTERQPLPNRREHELPNFEHGGISYTAGAGWFEDGRLAEIFLSTAKHGTAVDTNARDAAVAASLLLQHGCSVDTLR